MKQGIHPEYVLTEVTCTCGNHFTTRSTLASGQMRVDVCSACHPFYTGKQKILDTGGRVARFEARYAKFNDAKKKAADKAKKDAEKAAKQAAKAEETKAPAAAE